MTFSQEWDRRYQRTGLTSQWPWSDLVRLFRRHFSRSDTKNLRVLELGCGSGPNIPFFLSEGVDYFAIEGSATVVNELLKSYPTLKDNILAGDFTDGIPFDLSFDVIVDRSSLTHNDTPAIRRTLVECHSKLADGGIYIGVDWFSGEHSELQYGSPLEGDPFTYHAFTAGQFGDVGRVHASSEEHLHALFEHFNMLWLEKKTMQQRIPDAKLCHVTWNFVASKR